MTEAPKSSSLTDRFFRAVGQHFVSLSCVRTKPGESKIEAFAFSGFVIEAGGVWFYITAGHVIRDIRDALQNGYVYDRWRLDDQTAGNQFGGMAIPYGFDERLWFDLYDEVTGLDYAGVALDVMYCDLLRKGNVIPIGREAWGNHLMDHDQWALVGIPHETVAYDSQNSLVARVAVLPLTPTDPPEVAGRSAENKFFAKLTDMGNLNSVVGMSGGPVFALKKVEAGWKYKVIGVQASWYSGDRVVAVCPISSWAGELERVVKISTSADSQTEPSVGLAG